MMKRMTSRKSHSWWWDSHVSPKNSRWLSENLKKMDLLVKEMLKLIEEDGDSFAKKAEMYYKRRPELVFHVEEFYRMYRALAERYDIVTGELRKNIPSELQSQGSGSSFSQSLPPSPEKTPDQKPNHRHSPFEKAAGFDCFLGSRDSSDLSRKGSDDSSSSSSSEAGSESDDGNVVDVDESSSLLEDRIIELENELCDLREKLQQYQNGSIAELENSTALSEAQISNYLEEIKHLSDAMEAEMLSRDLTFEYYKSSIATLKVEVKQLSEEKVSEHEQMFNELKNKFIQEKSILESKLQNLEAERADATNESDKHIAAFKQLSEEKFHLESRISDHEQMFSELKYKFIQEKSILQSKLQNLEAEFKISRLNKLKQAMSAENTAAFKLKINSLTSENDALNARVSSFEEDMERQNDHLHQLHIEHVNLIKQIDDARKGSQKLNSRVKELEVEVEKQKVLIMEGAEGKREAIRQLCFSIQHYRDGYKELVGMIHEHCKRPAVMAT
ncbi:hypothetical protein AXF42_Ash004467 [Apostasia shenzhenica]|uniref:NAB domain-containing protein n=1 Tax=Apostasia shenzhenica TaxID=1088818 RepID=A0A2I0BGP9_9ASPA|nr:hypothetical protein AXF42_Ash004467 [Apostasia shenzhenica]